VTQLSTVKNQDRSPGAAAVETLSAAVRDWSADQLLWASGYLAGLAAGGDAAPASAVQSSLCIVYGSQTGNGRRVAEELLHAAAAAGIVADSINMADYPAARLRQDTLVVFVVSTHGDGDPPDDAIELHRFLGGRRASGLGSLNYAVLALGDSSYEHFCQTGQEFDQRLAAAGARRLLPLVECDLDYQSPARSWAEQLLEQARDLAGTDNRTATGPALRAVPAPPRCSRESPVTAELLLNQRITGRGSDKDVRHLEFSLADSALQYLPGDSLGVLHRNPPWIVDPLIEATGLNPEADGEHGESLREALATRRELTGLNRPFLEAWSRLPGAEALAPGLAEDQRAEMARWMSQRQIIDVVREFPVRVSADALLAALRPLTPRLYSIASAPELTPDEVHLTVAVVNYNAHGQPHWGAASSWLADACDDGDPVRVFVEANDRFRLPTDPDAPVIMIGPGTGVAPFRAFLQARQAHGASGHNWLFFGDRRFHSDFLYQSEWLRYRRQGLLTRLDVAFSRDQAEKRYVQHVMSERGKELFAWLEDGAYVYVCGDASRMAPDVERALAAIIGTHGGLNTDAATEYLGELRRSGRYRRDVY